MLWTNAIFGECKRRNSNKNYFLIAHTYPSPPVSLQFSTISSRSSISLCSTAAYRKCVYEVYVCCKEMEENGKYGSITRCYAIFPHTLGGLKTWKNLKPFQAKVTAGGFGKCSVAEQPRQTFFAGRDCKTFGILKTAYMKYLSNWRWFNRKTRIKFAQKFIGKMRRSLFKNTVGESFSYARAFNKWHWKSTQSRKAIQFEGFLSILG